MGHHAAFVTAGRLDADAPDMGAPQRRGQALPTGRLIVNGEMHGVAVNGHIELVLGGIDPRRKRGSIQHLRRPCLVKRTWCSGNHAGPMKQAGADPATLQPTTAQGGPIRRQPPDPGWPPRVGRSSRNRLELAGLAITRAEKRRGWARIQMKGCRTALRPSRRTLRVLLRMTVGL
jgi:hypothetical protein